MKKRNLPTPEALLGAIRARCLDCCGNSRKEVENCKLEGCPLHPYRCQSALGMIESKEPEIKGQLCWFDGKTTKEGKV